MVNSSQRNVVHATEEWSIPQVTQALFSALRGEGPAVAFGQVNEASVEPEIAVIVATTGSTGSAKSVAISASSLIASARAAHKYLGAKSGQRWSLLLPIDHIAGINVLVRSIELGTATIDNRQIGNRVGEPYTPAEFLSIVPTQLHRALNGDQLLLEHLRAAKKVLVGGAKTNEHLVRDARLQNIEIVTTYGMSEMCGGCVYDGHPLEGVESRITETGLIQLRGPSMASGYLNAPELWQELTKDGWFTTSDLGELSDSHLEILGRSDDQIITGGKKVSLAVVESTASEVFPEINFTAFAVADAEWGEKLCLAADKSFDNDRLRQVLVQRFGPQAAPKEILIVAALPMMGIGKPDRRALEALIASSE